MLNLDAIRDRASHDASDGSAATGPTRREFLAITGTACLAIPTALRGNHASNDFTIVEGPNRVAFVVEGVERWVIDGERFAGNPRVSLRRQTRDRIRVRLRGALYPGTNLRADLRCNLWRRIGGWRMHLYLDAFRATFDAPFVAWLVGTHALQCRQRSSTAPFTIGDLHLSLHECDVEFRTDWSLHVQGHRAITISRRGAEIVNDTAAIALAGESTPSLLQPLPALRTIITLNRGEDAWSFDLTHFEDGHPWSLDAADPFDRLFIEAGANERYAMLSTSPPTGEAMRFRPGGDLGRGSDSAFSMPLTGVRYAIASENGREQHALLARFAPMTFALGRFAAHLDGGGDAAFEILSDGDAPATPVVAPNMCGVSLMATSPAAVVQTFNVHARASIPFRWDSLPCELDRLGRWIRVKLRGSRVVWSDPKASILRPQDLLKLDFELRNFDLIVSHRHARAVRRDRTRPALLIVTFPPQHIAEDAELETSPQPPITPPLVSRMAGDSRLVFCVPDFIADRGLPWSVAALMDWRAFPMHVVPLATPREEIEIPASTGGCSAEGGGPAREPRNDETAIEAPFRLLLSPNRAAGWAHSIDPVESRAACPIPPAPVHDDAVNPPRLVPSTCAVCVNDGKPPQQRGRTLWERIREELHCEPPRRKPRTELWHTRMGVRPGDWINENDPALRTVRAVWARDLPMCVSTTAPFDHPPLTPRQRCNLVQLTTNDSHPGFGPIDVERLLLTSLGATLRLRAIWDQDEKQINKYIHRAAIGRDEYVELTQAGVLYPLGHPALVITITERKFNRANVPGDGTTPAAFLVQRKFIQIVRRTQTYPVIEGDGARSGRQMPFRSVTIDIDQTPNLAAPADEALFWPALPGNLLYSFPFTVDDGVNPKISSAMPLQFVGRTVLKNDVQMTAVGNSYNSSDEARRTALFGNKKIAYLPGRATSDGQPPTGSDNDPSLETEAIVFAVELVPTPLPWQDTDVKFARDFYPAVKTARVKIPAVEQISPNAGATSLAYAAAYIKSGFDVTDNRGEVYLQVTGTPPKLSFKASGNPGDTPKGGAVATPESVIAGLSRTVGAIQGAPNKPGDPTDSIANAVANIANGHFDPFAAFADAKILGGINLADVIAAVGPLLGDTARDFAKFPKLVADAIRDVTKNIDEARAAAKRVLDNLTSGNALQSELQEVQKKLLQEVETLASGVNTALIAKVEAVLIQKLEPLRDEVLAVLATVKATEEAAVGIRRAFAPELTRRVEELISGIGKARGIAEVLPGGRVFAVLARLQIALQNDEPLQLIADVVRAGADLRDAVKEELAALANPAAYLTAIGARLEEVAEQSFNDAKAQIETDLHNARDMTKSVLGSHETALQTKVETEIEARITEIKKEIDDRQQAVAQLLQEVENAIRGLADESSVPPPVDALRSYFKEYVLRKIEEAIASATGLPREIRIRYDFKPELKDFLVFVASLNGEKAALTITTELRKSILPTEIAQPPTYSVEGHLKSFQVRLLENPEFIRVRFKKLSFVSRNGSKPDIDVDIDGIEFGGALSFVKDLQSYLDKLNPANGPFIKLEGLGILAGYRFTLPPITLGAFNLTNVALSASVSLPFTGDPLRLRFGFSDRQKHFLLSVSVFGGGGYFQMALGADGVEMLEGALEFGAVAQLDLAVAHGEAHIMGGIYFKREANAAILTGYVRAGGSFDVLGLISASIEFYMGLTMRVEGGNCLVYGEAEVTVEIDILFFSASVHVYTRHEFAGSKQQVAGMSAPALPEPQPAFLTAFQDDVMWDAYQAAFA